MTRDGKAAGVSSTGGVGETAAGQPQSHGEYITPAQQRQQPKHGRVTGDTWRKSISKSAGQMLRQPAAIAVDASDLTAAELGGVRWLEILERDDCRRYLVAISTFRTCGIPIERRFGPQIALTLDYWAIDGQPPRRQPAQPKPNAPQQLSLFGAKP